MGRSEKRNQRGQTRHHILASCADLPRPVLKTADTRRDYGESRFIALGMFDEVVLGVVFTERDSDIRIISAWKASKHDREKFQIALSKRAP
jgi:uncharacterized DUF497 family protein